MKEERSILVVKGISIAAEDIAGRLRKAGCAASAAPHRRRARHTVQEGDSWCMSILNSIGDAVIVTDRQGRVLFMNPVAERMTGWRFAGAKGLPLQKIFKIVSEDRRKPLSIPLRKILKRGSHDGIAGHVVLVNRNGAATHIEDSVTRLSDDNGQIQGLVLVFRDVTERHLAASRVMSRQKIEAIGAMAGGLAREFGRIMVTISSHAASLSEGLIPETQAWQDAMTIMEKAKSATGLTRQLANVARASASGSERDVQDVSLAEAVASAARLLDPAMAANGIRLDTDDTVAWPLVRVNEPLLVDVLMGIFNNAVEAMPDGGVLSVEAKTKAIAHPNLKLNPNARRGRYSVVTIRDTGRGMTAETLAHIFDPFFTTKDPDLARGLGMTMVHNTILSWGGWITAKSKPGIGTAIALHLPCARKRAGGRTGRESAAGRTIMVVDNKESSLSTFKNMLENERYKVLTAKNAAEATALLHRHRNSLAAVIVDLIIPGSDVRRLVGHIARTAPQNAIIMTSGFSRDYVRTFLGHGGWSYVQKPVEREHLAGVIARAMEQRNPAEQTQTSLEANERAIE